MKTAAERKRDERKRNHDRGLIQRSIWIKPEHWALIQLLVDKLKKP